MRYKSNELFRSTASYYARYRDGYPSDFFDMLVRRFGLDETASVLDLGTGTGQIALKIAPLVGRVVAVDPEAGMLDEARRLADAAGVTNVTWRLGDSRDIAGIGQAPFTVATLGASFHWMDRDTVLGDLDRIVAADGGVVLVSNHADDPSPPAWKQTIDAVRAEWLGPQRRAGDGTYTHPSERHEVVIARSPFARLETWSRTHRIERDLDEVIGLQFSYSFSAPALFDQRKDAFERSLRERLRAVEPSGRFIENIRTVALIATRPRH